MFLQSDNSSMWTMGNLMGILFFLVIVILGIVIWRMVAGGKSSSVDYDDE